MKLDKIEKCIECSEFKPTKIREPEVYHYLCKKLNRFLSTKDFEKPEFGDNWHNTIPACCPLYDSDLFDDMALLIKDFNDLYVKGSQDIIDKRKYFEMLRAFENSEMLLERLKK